MLTGQLFKERAVKAKLQWSVLVRCSNCGKEFRTMTVQIGSKQASKDFNEKCPHCAHQIHTVHKTCSGRIDKLESFIEEN